MAKGQYKGIIFNETEDGQKVQKVFFFEKPEFLKSINISLNKEQNKESIIENGYDLNDSEKVGTAANLERIIDLFGTNMYSNQIQETTIKELFQNSFDSLKSAINTGKIDPESAEIGIYLDPLKNMVQVKDNGVGMSPQTVKEAFLTIAGTMKDGLSNEERSGGFGVAKLAFLFGSERLKLVTVKDGIKTTIDTSGKELLNQSASMKTEKTDEPNSTNIKAYLPSLLKDKEGNAEPVLFVNDLNLTAFFQNPLIGDIKIKDLAKNEYIQPGGKKNINSFIPFGTMKCSWGTIDLFIHPKEESNSWHANHTVLSSGLYQFNTTFKKGTSRNTEEKFPYHVILNVKPSVDASDKHYPFNKQREDWNPNIQEDILMTEAYIKAINKRMETENIMRKFGKIQTIPQKQERDPENITFSDFNKTDISKNLSNFFIKGIDHNQPIIIQDNILKQNNIEILKRHKIEYDFQLSGPILGRENYLEEEIDDQHALFHQNLSKDIITETQKQNPSIAENDIKSFMSDISDVMKEYKETLVKLPLPEERGF